MNTCSSGSIVLRALTVMFPSSKPTTALGSQLWLTKQANGWMQSPRGSPNGVVKVKPLTSICLPVRDQNTVIPRPRGNTGYTFARYSAIVSISRSECEYSFSALAQSIIRSYCSMFVSAISLKCERRDRNMLRSCWTSGCFELLSLRIRSAALELTGRTFG